MNESGQPDLRAPDASPDSWRRLPTPKPAARAPAPRNIAVDVLLEQALAQHREDRLEEAETFYREILAVDPQHADALHLLGLIGHQFGQYGRASELIMAAIEIKPQAIYFYNLGNVMQAQDLHAAAAECFRQAIALQSDYVDAYLNLGSAQRSIGDLTSAVESLCTVISLKPDHAQAYTSLAKTMMELGELDAAIESHQNAAALRPDLPELRSNLLAAFNQHSSFTQQAYLDEAARFNDLIGQRAKPWKNWLVERTARTNRALRVGIVSGDLIASPVGRLLENVLANLNASRVEMYAYTTRDIEDGLSRRIKPRFASWTSIAGQSDEFAAARIRADGIDVLIDASGHADHNRLPVFAWKPAPVQVSWAGYFASTGVRAIDYVLGDRYVLPESEAGHFTEQQWHLPDSHLCFAPLTVNEDVGPLPMLANGYATFGYFGELARLGDSVVALWSRVLDAVPDSKLFLKARHLDSVQLQETIVARFAAHGIDSQRLILDGRLKHEEHLAAYRRVDIVLSPFPHQPGSAVFESLWMGVPVLCRRGDRFLSHIGTSMLNAARLKDWIVETDDAYVEKAVAFGNDPEQLAALRGVLRAQLLASPLCNVSRFARHVEDALHGMWSRYVESAAQELQDERTSR